MPYSCRSSVFDCHKNAIGLRARLGMRSQAQRYLWLPLFVVQTLDIHLGSQVRVGRSDHVVCQGKQVLMRISFLSVLQEFWISKVLVRKLDKTNS